MPRASPVLFLRSAEPRWVGRAPAFEVIRQGIHGRIASFRILPEAGRANGVEVERNCRIEPAWRRRLLMTDLIHRLGERCGAERGSARQELIKDRAQSINVRGRPDREATRFKLLGRHI